MDKKIWYVIVAVLAVALVGYVMMRDDAEETETETETEMEEGTTGGANNGAAVKPGTETRDEAEDESGMLSAYLTVNYNPAMTFSPETLQVKNGQHVVLKVTSTVADTITIQGYDSVATQVQAGATATVEFDAETSGQFKVMLKDHAVLLGTLDVLPITE